MIIAKVQISGTSARTICCQEIPRGIVGAKVALEYDEELWSGLTKKVVFTNGLRTVELVDPGESVELPPEVVDTVGKNVSIGVCGTDADGKLVIPTLWAVLSCVRNAVPVEADEAAEPTLPVWAQLLAMIGNTKDLKTQAKDNLVAAVNELVASGGEIDAAEVQRIVEEYLAANMPEVDLPEALPNPQPLTFTGAVEVTYDGSEPLEVVIPQGGGLAGEKWELLQEFDFDAETKAVEITDNVSDISEIVVVLQNTGTARFAFGWLTHSVNGNSVATMAGVELSANKRYFSHLYLAPICYAISAHSTSDAFADGGKATYISNLPTTDAVNSLERYKFSAGFGSTAHGWIYCKRKGI